MKSGRRNEHELLTAKEVAVHLRMPVSTVYHLVKTKDLPAIQIGRTLRFRAREIEALLHGKEGKGRILIIDDDVTVLRLLGTLLQQEGYEIETAASVGAACGLIANQSFDLLLVDMLLPDGTGVDLVEELPSVYAKERVILMTAYADVEKVNRLLRRYPLTLLKKPIDFDQLRECINVRLNGARRGK